MGADNLGKLRHRRLGLPGNWVRFVHVTEGCPDGRSTLLVQILAVLRAHPALRLQPFKQALCMQTCVRENIRKLS